MIQLFYPSSSDISQVCKPKHKATCISAHLL
uniref:Uncharacterized protein n=1 Tax=Arundo donax TaxID=35708 RepID=A0A0A9EEN1_ARUDO